MPNSTSKGSTIVTTSAPTELVEKLDKLKIKRSVAFRRGIESILRAEAYRKKEA